MYEKPQSHLPSLSARLQAVASLVRRGSVVCDVGTDHAYLPIVLVGSGIAPRAIASDVRTGPLERASEHIAAFGLSDRIDILLTDGLCGIEPYRPDDILICGMGGELIASILAASDYVRNRQIRLILQPMTMAHKLRTYLSVSGFAIGNERLVLEKDEKLYQIFTASYVGSPCPLSSAELYLGVDDAERDPLLWKRHAENCIRSLTARVEGLQRANRPADVESEILDKLRRKVDEVTLKEIDYGNR